MLVSVSLITYNSERYIFETLESIRLQTYSDIELIISDDCSTDNTVSICKEWVNENKSRFFNVRLVESPINKGISANYNQGMKACSGEWIKEIAGDDLLLPTCIADFVEYINQNPTHYFCFSKVDVFDGDEKRRQKQIDYFEYDSL